MGKINEMIIKLPTPNKSVSKGEQHLAKTLQAVSEQLNTFYGEEFKIGFFKGKSRRADFYIMRKGSLYLFEFDGIQHSRPIEDFGGIDTFKEIKQRDRWENLKFSSISNTHVIRYKVFSKDSSKEECIKAQNDLLNFITPERILNDINKSDQCAFVQNSRKYHTRYR